MSITDALLRRPDVSVINLQTSEVFEAPTVPRSFEWGVSPQYAVPTSYRNSGANPHHYTGTANFNATMAFELVSYDEPTVREHRDFARFIQSLCYPPEDTTDLLVRAPPDVAIFWSNYLDLICKVTDLRGAADLFFGDGTPKRETLTLTLSEVRITRVTGEARRQLGLRLGSIQR